MKIPFTCSAPATLACLLITGSLAACTYGSYDDAVARYYSGLPPPPPPPPPGGFGPNFSEIQANVFTPDCATGGCHSGAIPPAGLNLEAANSFMQLVGMASSQDGNIPRVDPFNPNNSYLIQKLEGTAAANPSAMPPGAPLPQAEIDVIRQWITDGAIDDQVQASTPIRVDSLDPTPGAALNAAPTQITAGFDREPDASTVTESTFLLEGSGGDGSFGEINDVRIPGVMRISVPVANPQSAVFDLTGVALADDTYRISLLGDGASVILDLDANALDGEFAGVFPSGDDTEGGDFEAQFTITTPTMDLIQATVFSPRCAGCHSGAMPAGALDLSDADTSHLQLIGIASSAQAGAVRVIPFDPGNSYLIHKLEGAVGINGVQMPPGAPLLQPTIDDIRLWISNGAIR